MHPMARRWPQRTPWDEVWFLEIDLGPDRTVWLRYVLGDGPHRRGLATWAILTEGPRISADQGRYDLGGLRPDQPVAHGDDLWLSADAAGSAGGEGRGRAKGKAGGAHWDLELHVGPRAHRMVSPLVERMGVGRTYVPAVLDLRVTGTVEVGGRRLVLDRAPGVLGHIWGASNRTTAWAWCHGHAVDEDVLFEGLAVRLGRLPVLTTIGVWWGDEHVDLSKTRQLLRTRSWLDGDRWRFVAKRRGVEVRGEARLPDPARVATVRYLDSGDGQVRGCRNSGLSSLDLTLTHNGRVRHVVMPQVAFELAQVGEPGGAVVLSD